jgi:ankyrin repeat protein
LGFIDGVRALLSAGADPTISNHEGATAFDYCTDKNILGIYNEELLQAAAGGK